MLPFLYFDDHDIYRKWCEDIVQGGEPGLRLPYSYFSEHDIQVVVV